MHIVPSAPNHVLTDDGAVWEHFFSKGEKKRKKHAQIWNARPRFSAKKKRTNMFLQIYLLCSRGYEPEKMQPVLAEPEVEEMSHFLCITLPYAMLVTAYHKIFVLVHNHVIGRLAWSAYARADYAIYIRPYMALCGMDRIIHELIHLLTLSWQFEG